MQLIWVILSIFQLDFVMSQKSFNPEELRDWCIDAQYHKKLPGPEDQLHSQCLPWKDHACCTEDSSKDIHINNKRYGVNRNHCPGTTLSEKCNRHFVQDLCFYDCEPNLGPWVVSVNQTKRKERFIYVPLCASDCDQWFADCEHEQTCVKNWLRDLTWINGETHCPTNTPCKTFKEIYQNSSTFCEKIWDDSWKYTPDDQSCMRLWFDSSNGNPNKLVANYRIDQLTAMWNGDTVITASLWMLALATAMLMRSFH